jgi:hypothetical protein
VIDNPKKDLPEGVQAALEALVHRVMARCDQMSIAWADYYQALLEEEKQSPKISVEDLFERAFQRVQRISN